MKVPLSLFIFTAAFSICPARAGVVEYSFQAETNTLPIGGTVYLPADGILTGTLEYSTDVTEFTAGGDKNYVGQVDISIGSSVYTWAMDSTDPGSTGDTAVGASLHNGTPYNDADFQVETANDSLEVVFDPTVQVWPNDEFPLPSTIDPADYQSLSPLMPSHQIQVYVTDQTTGNFSFNIDPNTLTLVENTDAPEPSTFLYGAAGALLISLSRVGRRNSRKVSRKGEIK